jgi:hypothetical protein
MLIAEAVSRGLKNSLVECSIKGQFIETHQWSRGIGKTTALVEFAKVYGFNVITNDSRNARHMRDKFNYEKIYGQGESLRGLSGDFVIDEVVDRSKLEGCKIITGFVMV